MGLSRFKIYKMYKRSRFGRQGGFSLVELMVVVAIIGILAAIAIPNYQRFQRKARQSEAKIIASGIFTAEKAFISEWGFGSTNIRQIGFSPDGVINYLAGFSAIEVGNIVNSETTRLTGYNGPLAADEQDIDTFSLCAGAHHSSFQDGSNIGSCIVAAGADYEVNGSTPLTFGSLNSCLVASGSGTCTLASGGASCNASTTSPVTTCTLVNGGVLLRNIARNSVSFSIGMIGNIGGDGIDVWLMDQNKTMLNQEDGTQ